MDSATDQATAKRLRRAFKAGDLDVEGLRAAVAAAANVALVLIIRFVLWLSLLLLPLLLLASLLSSKTTNPLVPRRNPSKSSLLIEMFCKVLNPKPLTPQAFSRKPSSPH